MENNRPPAKRRDEEEAAAGSMEEEDRISELPQHILHHHILSLLPRKDAVRTCILSKSWRCLVSTRPWIEFYETSFPRKEHEFLSVIENTLQRYDDQKLSIQEFTLEMLAYDSESRNNNSVLDKWIPIVLSNMGLKKFKFSANHFSLPPAVFQAEFLEELFLKGCNLNQIFNSTGEVQALNCSLQKLSLDSVIIEEETFEKIMSSCTLIEHLVLEFPRRELSEHCDDLYHLHCNYFFPRLKSLYLCRVQLPKEWLNNLSLNNCPCLLQTLTLKSVRIEDETFVKIMSICPLIQHLVLFCCRSLSTVKVKMARNLKHFECENSSLSIEINDAPSLETIRINKCQNWCLNFINYFFPSLKSLLLLNVHLPTEFLSNLSSILKSNCPCLEELELRHCSGFGEVLELSNRSIKRMIIILPDRPIKAVFDAANMLYFEFSDFCLPSISFAKTSREWKSHIEVWCCKYFDAAWYLKLYEFLKALSQSQISLGISYLPNLTNQDNCDGESCEPVVVENLCLNICSYEVPALLNRALRIFRPRYIGLPLHYDSQEKYVEPIWKTLVEKGETKFWQKDLEETSIQVSDKNANEWRPRQVCELSNKEEIRFRLKWREIH